MTGTGVKRVSRLLQSARLWTEDVTRREAECGDLALLAAAPPCFVRRPVDLWLVGSGYLHISWAEVMQRSCRGHAPGTRQHMGETQVEREDSVVIRITISIL